MRNYVEVVELLKFSRILPAVALLVLTPFFFIGGPSPVATPLFNSLWDCGHIIFFSLLAVLLVQKFLLTSCRAWLWLTLAVFVLGGAIEIVQAHTGRSGSWQDLLRDLTGTWLGLFLVRNKQTWVYAGRVLAVGLLGMNAYWVLLSGAGLLYAYHSYPVLADFESSLSTQTIKANGLRDKPLRDKTGKPVASENSVPPVKTYIERSQEHASAGAYSLKIVMGNQRYAGVAFNQLMTNWSSYAHLEFDLYNPGAVPLMMLVRISDKQHDLGGNHINDRYNRYINMLPGWNHVDINLEEVAKAPEHRRMNMDEITSLVICANRLREPQIVYLDNVQLRK